MIHTLILVHATLMSLSILATLASVGLTSFGRHVPKLANGINSVITAMGVGLGVVLLLDKPLGIRCAVLTAYLAAFIFAQVYIAIRSKKRTARSTLAS